MRYISVIMCFVITLSLFCVRCYGCVTAHIDIQYIPREETYISAFSADSLNDIIKPKAVYADDNGHIKAVTFKLDSNIIPSGLSMRINGTVHDITSLPENNGMVYEYLDDNIIIDDSQVIVQFFSTYEETSPVKLNPVKMVTSENGNWTASEDGHTLYLYNGTDKNITVPNFYNNIIVTTVGGYVEKDIYTNILRDATDRAISSAAISEGIININHFAFYNISTLRDITLPDSLENIGKGAFAYSPIRQITIPQNLKGLYPYAFFECRELTGEIIIPGGVNTIGEAAFYNCPKITGSIVISEGVEEIGDMAFAGAGIKQHFTSLELPDTLKRIGCYAFQNCVDIAELALPEGLEIISDGAFDHMSGISNSTLVIPSTVTTIGGDYNVEQNTLYGGHVFYDMGQNSTFTAFEVADGNQYFKTVDGILYSADMTRMLAYPRGKRDTVFEIPEGVTQLDEMAFSRASYLKTIILPDSYEIKTSVPENILNQDGNSLAVALYVYTTVANVEVKSTNTRYASSDGILYSKDMKSLWYIPTQHTGTISISDKCERLEKGCIFIAGRSNTGWENVSISPSVFWIDNAAADFLNTYFKGYIKTDGSIYYTIDSDGGLTELTYLMGDANMDDKTDRLDACLVLRLISGIADGSKINKKAADVSSDGYIDITDIIDIMSLS